MRLTACSKLQSIVACSSVNSSVASQCTSACLSCWRTSMPRDSISRLRCSSASRIMPGRSRRSLDSRTRPERKRLICWPMMPRRRASSTSSRSACRLARSIRPVVARVWTRSSADDEALATSLPSCATSAMVSNTVSDASASGGAWPARLALVGRTKDSIDSCSTAGTGRPERGELWRRSVQRRRCRSVQRRRCCSVSLYTS